MDHPDILLFIIVMLIFVFCIYLVTFVIVTTQGKSWFSHEVENEVKVGWIRTSSHWEPSEGGFKWEHNGILGVNDCSVLCSGIEKKIKGLGHTY